MLQWMLCAAGLKFIASLSLQKIPLRWWHSEYVTVLSRESLGQGVGQRKLHFPVLPAGGAYDKRAGER